MSENAINLRICHRKELECERNSGTWQRQKRAHSRSAIATILPIPSHALLITETVRNKRTEYWCVCVRVHACVFIYLLADFTRIKDTCLWFYNLSLVRFNFVAFIINWNFLSKDVSLQYECWELSKDLPERKITLPTPNQQVEFLSFIFKIGHLVIKVGYADI